MSESGRLTAGIWFSSYMVLVSLIMLNMLLAMVMDCYTHVKGQISSSETLFEQAYEIYRRFVQKQKGLRVSLHHINHSYTLKFGMTIDEVLSRGGLCEEIVQAKEFMDVVYGLGEHQATRLLTAAVQAYQAQLDSSNPLSISNAMIVISKIHQKLDHHIMQQKETQQKDIPNNSKPSKAELRRSKSDWFPTAPKRKERRLSTDPPPAAEGIAAERAKIDAFLPSKLDADIIKAERVEQGEISSAKCDALDACCIADMYKLNALLAAAEISARRMDNPKGPLMPGLKLAQSLLNAASEALSWQPERFEASI